MHLPRHQRKTKPNQNQKPVSSLGKTNTKSWLFQGWVWLRSMFGYCSNFRMQNPPRKKEFLPGVHCTAPTILPPWPHEVDVGLQHPFPLTAIPGSPFLVMSHAPSTPPSWSQNTPRTHSPSVLPLSASTCQHLLRLPRICLLNEYTSVQVEHYLIRGLRGWHFWSGLPDSFCLFLFLFSLLLWCFKLNALLAIESLAEKSLASKS